jgi:uncharacterized membrane protein
VNRLAAAFLLFGIILLPIALADRKFTGVSLVGCLAVIAAIALTILGAPSKGHQK